MTAIAFSNWRERTGGAVAALAVTAALGAVLALGLAVREQLAGPDDEVAMFEVLPEPKPRPKTQRMPERNTRPAGEAAPPNLRSRATEVVVPKPLVPIVVQPLVIVTEKAADGVQTTSGAAEVAGPGTGAGGEGDGFGGGGSGDGDGAGDPDATPPRQIRGRIRDSDYPDDLADAGVGGRVTVVFLVQTDGRVTECEVDGSSGIARLDALTCRLIRERFRFRPSRDGKGRPVPAYVRETHEWVFERLPPEPD
ncbi:energy transducer TonB [Sphingomonas sp. MS122]|uniref:energy transducer TonB n=1 Tax=Sphingomonas sp. MS122 TaxID=3412683 RepID=UPI003C2B0977